MINNVEHLSYVHYQLAHHVLPVISFDWLNKAHSIAVVLIFEIVIITFVMEGHKGFAGFFSFCIFILSQVYYEVPDLLAKGKYIEALAATTYSVIFTISPYMFSELLASHHEKQNEVMQQIETNHQLRQQLNQTKATLNQKESEAIKLQSTIEVLQSNYTNFQQQVITLTKTNSTLEKQIQAAKEKLKCPYCSDYTATTDGQLRAHKGHCPQNPINQKS